MNQQTVAPTPYQLPLPANVPPPLLPSNNPLTVEGVELGRRLFFDPILSIDSTVACATCHPPATALSDPDQFSTGVAGQTQRHSMPLINLAWAPSLFWDGRAPSLESQALEPVIDHIEMGESWDHVVEKLNNHTAYPSLFRTAFNAPDITPELTVNAIAQFERTLISFDSKLDRVLAGQAEATAQERLGWELFNSERGDCFHCHGTVLFTTHQFHNNGLDLVPADSGLAAVTRDRFDLGKFKVPTLRNVEHTAPYMHDGRFNTLEEVIEFYANDIQPSSHTDPLLLLTLTQRNAIPLTQEEKDALVAFLKMLSDDAFLKRIQVE